MRARSVTLLRYKQRSIRRRRGSHTKLVLPFIPWISLGITEKSLIQQTRIYSRLFEIPSSPLAIRINWDTPRIEFRALRVADNVMLIISRPNIPSATDDEAGSAHLRQSEEVVIRFCCQLLANSRATVCPQVYTSAAWVRICMYVVVMADDS